MVVDKLGVRPGDDVLVMAAGSGVSVAAIQIAKLFGARVIATAGSEDKLRRAKALGADETVNYTHPDWPKEVRRLTGGKGADKVVDHTGALYFEGVIKATANGGRIAIAGASSGTRAPCPSPTSSTVSSPSWAPPWPLKAAFSPSCASWRRGS